jgi:hypothetical protein
MPYGRVIKKSTHLRDKRIQSFVLKSGLLTLFFLLVLIVAIFVSRLERFKITDINIKGNFVTPNEQIKKIISKELSGYYLKMFPRNNIVLYPRDRIEEVVLDEIKRIKTIRLVIEKNNNLKAEVLERKPDMLWCGESYSSDSKCFFVDEEGLVYSDAPTFSGNVFLKGFGQLERNNENSKNVFIGLTFMPYEKFQTMKYFINVLKNTEFQPMSVSKLNQGDIDVYLERGGRLIYSSSQDVTKLSQNITSIISDPEFKSNLDKELDYIDLRLGNKVYYKFK